MVQSSVYGNFKSKQALFQHVVSIVVAEYFKTGLTPTCFAVFKDQAGHWCDEIAVNLDKEGITFSNSMTDPIHWSSYKIQRDAYYDYLEAR